jgi:hypothetical protein
MNFLQNSDLSPTDVMIFIVCAVLALVMVITVALIGAHKSKMRMKRVMAVTGKADTRAKNTVNVRRATADSSIAAFDYLIKRFLPNPQRMRMRLWRTGRTITLGQYLLFWPPRPSWGWRSRDGRRRSCAFCGLRAFLIPHIAIGTMNGRRQDKFMRTFPRRSTDRPRPELPSASSVRKSPIRSASSSVASPMP